MCTGGDECVVIPGGPDLNGGHNRDIGTCALEVMSASSFQVVLT